jgi:hypothetical protein
MPPARNAARHEVSEPQLAAEHTASSKAIDPPPANVHDNDDIDGGITKSV